jgi:transketolase
MHAFGTSAPLQDMKNRFGFTPQAISSIARRRLAERNRRAGR